MNQVSRLQQLNGEGEFQVRLNEYLTVGDHDFTKFGLTPSVILIKRSAWWNLWVLVQWTSVHWPQGYGIWNFLATQTCMWAERYPPVCFTPEVSAVCVQRWWTRLPPDLCLSSVVLDMSLSQVRPGLLVCRPNSPLPLMENPRWIMSILNLGLQCVGLAREKMPDEYESEAVKCKSPCRVEKDGREKRWIRRRL